MSCQMTNRETERHFSVLYGVGRHVETCWDMLRHVETCWDMLRHVETCWDMLRHVESCWDMLRHVETCWDMLRHVETCWDMLSHVETCWDMLRHRISGMWRSWHSWWIIDQRNLETLKTGVHVAVETSVFNSSCWIPGNNLIISWCIYVLLFSGSLFSARIGVLRFRLYSNFLHLKGVQKVDVHKKAKNDFDDSSRKWFIHEHWTPSIISKLKLFWK
jgi:hypothetical protein